MKSNSKDLRLWFLISLVAVAVQAQSMPTQDTDSTLEGRVTWKGKGIAGYANGT